MLRPSRSAGVQRFAQSRLSIPTDKGTHAGANVVALVTPMLARTDSIEDMNVLRHGGMDRLFDRATPVTLRRIGVSRLGSAQPLRQRGCSTIFRITS